MIADPKIIRFNPINVVPTHDLLVLVVSLAHCATFLLQYSGDCYNTDTDTDVDAPVLRPVPHVSAILPANSMR